MRKAYLRVGEHLLVIAISTFELKLDTRDSPRATVSRNEILVIAYRTHEIADSVDIVVGGEQVVTPDIFIVGELMAYVGASEVAKNGLGAMVKVPLANVVTLRSNTAAGSFNYINAPVDFLVKHGLIATDKNWFSTPSTVPRRPGYSHSEPGSNNWGDWPVDWNWSRQQDGWGSKAVFMRDYKAVSEQLMSGLGVPAHLFSNTVAKPLYSICTWDSEKEKFTPQAGTETPCINVDIHGLRRHLRELKTMGYSCHRTKHGDSDPAVLVQRTDGKPLSEFY